jgi:hypothetical protein
LAGPSIRLRAPVRARPEAPRETPSWSPVSWMAEHMWICASIAVVSFPIIFAPYLRRSLTRRIVLTAVNRQTQTFDLERVSMVPWWRTFLTSKHAATNGAASAASATSAATALSSHSTAATPVEDMSGAALPADWSKRLSEIRIRRMIIRRLVDDASANDDSSLLATRNKKSAERLAATDLFVEKAQAILTERGWTLTTSGVICTAIGVAILVGGASVLQQSADPPDTLSVPAMMVRILKGAAIGGFFLGAAGFVLYLAKAMFHEATQLFSRRHALRFGRLYLYLTDGEIRKFDHMERAFQWTGEFSTAFKDIKYELPRGTLGDVSKVVQKIGEAAKSSRSGAPS